VARLLERPLDPARPLWEIWVVEGVAGDRVAVIPKVSHVMADGTALLGFALSLLDVSPEPAEVTDDGVGDAGTATEAPTRPGGPPTSAVAPVLAGATLARARRQAAVAAGALGALRRPWRVAVTGVALARWAAGARPAPRSPMNRPVGRRRDMTWLRHPLPELRSAARSLGASLNDVVLAAVAGALRDTSAGSPDGPGTRDLRAIVPVSTHGHVPGGEMENRFSVLLADLPVSVDDPAERVRRVHAEMQRRKGSSGVAIGSLLLSASDLAPAWLIRLLAPTILGRQPVANLAVTNVPGTDRPLYLLGARMTEAYPFVTVIGNISLIVGVLSYGDSLGVGVTVDPDVVGDVDGFTAALDRSFGDLVAIGRAVNPGSTSAGRRPRGRSAR
ncbi:MAG TPA: WS/DGAT domain-containing protein, partial [Acidimicrobiales bacterium]